LRETDLLGRVGGEEFAILLPSIGLRSAMDVAEKLRSALETAVIEHEGRRIPVTAVWVWLVSALAQSISRPC
jgi:diguanylate cyclase (GGDEF)-like protein